MAAPAVYQIKTASFKGTGVTGLKKFGHGQSGKSTDVLTDGAIAVTMVYIDGIVSEVTLETTDNLVAAGANFAIGSAGALILVEQKRAEGKGAVGAADKTQTFANAVLIDKQRGSNQEGDSTTVFKFRCADPNGADPCAYS